MKQFSFIVFIFCCMLDVDSDNFTSLEIDREGKFLLPIPYPFLWVRFQNSICIASNNLYGVCYTRRVCSLIDGQASGRCQTGPVGACCVVQRTCGAISSHNNTYFVNRNYPNPDTTTASCSIVVPPCDNTTCQLRLDFLVFSLAQPDGQGNCITDAMTIEGGASPVPIICGENSGQHIYIGFNRNANIKITIDINGAFYFKRKWTIRITQIGCSCPTLAPVGCLMYYMSLSGTVRSFNYGRAESVGTNGDQVNPLPGTRELANLNYGVCVDMRPGYCSIQWSQTTGDPYSFTVSGDTITATPGLPQNPLNGESCTTDYVVIPNPIGFVSDRFCGNQLRTVMTRSKPFVITVVTNEEETLDIGNRGFSLSYTQIPCPRLP